jgi:hypothetical protein
MSNLFTRTFWVRVASVQGAEFTVISSSKFVRSQSIFIDNIKIKGVYDSSVGQIALKLEVTDQNQTTHLFEADNSFSLNEWTFCGVSMYSFDRHGDNFEIHFVTKTKSGTEYQKTFNDQLIENN